MKLIDFRHVAEQDVLLAEQGGGDEVSHGRVVHLSRVALRDIFYLFFCHFQLLFSTFFLSCTYFAQNCDTRSAHLQHTQ